LTAPLLALSGLIEVAELILDGTWDTAWRLSFQGIQLGHLSG
jgi:hypothetical protein